MVKKNAENMSIEDVLTEVKALNSKFAGVLAKYPEVSTRTEDMLNEYLDKEENKFIDTIENFDDFEAETDDFIEADDYDGLDAYTLNYLSKLSATEKALLKELMVMDYNHNLFLNKTDELELSNHFLSLMN